MTWGEQNSKAEAHAQLDMAVDRGVNFFDSAEMYPVPARAETQGTSERFLGDWLVGRDRSRFVLATKVIGRSGLTWIRDGGGLNPPHLRTALEGSLRRLKTDYVDLYQLHWPDRFVPKFGGLHFDPRHYHDGTPIEETLTVLAQLIQEGKIRHYGLSNETPYGLAKFVATADKLGIPRPLTLQNAYNLLNRVFEIHLAESCFHEGIELMAYSVLAFGFLTGKYRRESLPDDARASLFPGFVKRYRPQAGPDSYALKTNAGEAIEAYAQLAGERGLTALALQFVKARPFAKSIIVGATSTAQLKENLDALAGDLPDGLVKAIDQIHWRYPNPCP